jgi:ubiquinone/menaquinone biosynthesis C-methylase UbiE
MKRFRGVDTTAVEHLGDVAAFFDRCAERGFHEQHGRPARLLAYRLGLIRRHARLRSHDVVLDVGCGNGHHLAALAPEIARGVGVDVSPRMIELARRACPQRIAFQVGDATRLDGVASSSVDLALCIGALEHMVDKAAALASIHRVLRPGGRFFCLTPDGAHPWYRSVAPRLGIATRHLSTDHFLTRDELRGLLERAGFARVELGAWSFIPRGDMPRLARWLFGGLDRILRGGLRACAWK